MYFMHVIVFCAIKFYIVLSTISLMKGRCVGGAGDGCSSSSREIKKLWYGSDSASIVVACVGATGGGWMN